MQNFFKKGNRLWDNPNSIKTQFKKGHKKLFNKHSEESKKSMSISKLSEKNPMWRDNPSIYSIQRWVKKRKINSNCEICGKNKKLYLFNISRLYKRDVSDYKLVCRECYYDASPELREKKSKHLKELWERNRTEMLKNRMGHLIPTNKERWKNKEYKENQIKKMLKGLLKRPTSFEQKIILLCSKYRLPFVYTGDGRMLINFKNPDFVNEKDKIVIEVFLNYFKIRDYGSIENYKEFCRKRYEPLGWKVIFIDENEINAKNWEEICLDKIQK